MFELFTQFIHFSFANLSVHAFVLAISCQLLRANAILIRSNNITKNDCGNDHTEILVIDASNI